MTTSVIIPTWNRPLQLKKTLQKILSCSPLPTEILVHVDAGDHESAGMMKAEFDGQVQWVEADITRGPGGGRDFLSRIAAGDLLVSFDDDSWPEDSDFFAQAVEAAKLYQKAAVIASSLTEPHTKPEGNKHELCNKNSFVNCGCVMRRRAYLDTLGYVNLRYAYGMEESDIALQLLDAGWDIVYAPSLRVFHDTVVENDATAEVNAAHITNTALLVYLRYPYRYWILGAAQLLNRILFSIRNRRYAGILKGIRDIPSHCYNHRGWRRPVRAKTIIRSRKLGKQSVK